ncbi:MAG: DUF2059 domain-containing protein [Desulfobacterales bacterium]
MERMEENLKEKPQYAQYKEILISMGKEFADFVYHDANIYEHSDNILATLLAEELSEKELRELITIFESDVYKKFEQKGLIILEKARVAGYEWGIEVFTQEKYIKGLENRIDLLKKEGKLPPDFPK